MVITLITGNAGKAAEWQSLLPSSVQLAHTALDLDEIQSLDLARIATDKAERAFALLKKPVVTEDVSIGLDGLNGLPGPFIKFFVEQLGPHALDMLAPADNRAATAYCTIGYHDGTTVHTFTGSTAGTIVAPRGDNGFGFDQVFQPVGSTKTYAEMTTAEKNAVSHRMKAVQSFAAFVTKD